jgi:hypothetical protein
MKRPYRAMCLSESWEAASSPNKGGMTTTRSKHGRGRPFAPKLSQCVNISERVVLLQGPLEVGWRKREVSETPELAAD